MTGICNVGSAPRAFCATRSPEPAANAALQAGTHPCLSLQPTWYVMLAAAVCARQRYYTASIIARQGEQQVSQLAGSHESRVGLTSHDPRVDSVRRLLLK